MSTEPATQAIAKSIAASPRKTFQTLVDSEHFKQQIVMALPKHLTPERFIRVLMTATVKTPKLLECTQESLFRCIFDAAAAGLEIDGRRAALVPLTNRKKAGSPLEANLWPMYQGIAELVMRSGLVSNIHADLVCDADEFEYDRGQLTKHKIDYRKDRGEPYATYSIIRMKDGSEKVEVMSYAEVERIRKASPGADADAWRNNWGEMAKKTVFKRAAKWVPLSAEAKNVLEHEPEPEPEPEPVNVTPKPSLAGLLAGTQTESPPPAIEQQPATGFPATEVAATESKPAEAATPEERAKVLAAVETGLLQWEVGETRALKWATENGHRQPGQHEISSLSTPALLALLDAIPNLKKGGAEK